MHPKKGVLKVWEHMHTTFPTWEKQEIEGYEQEQDKNMNKNKNKNKDLSKEG